MAVYTTNNLGHTITNHGVSKKIGYVNVHQNSSCFFRQVCVFGCTLLSAGRERYSTCIDSIDWSHAHQDMVDKKVGFRRLPCISGLNMITPIEKTQISCPSWLFSPAQEALRQKLAEAEASPKMGEIPIDNGDAMIAVM